ncbi:MAG: hypothetical protein K0S76_1454 [Herbinix sp.]|nr:hypothetical protein [Herbinix sp.]
MSAFVKKFIESNIRLEQEKYKEISFFMGPISSIMIGVSAMFIPKITVKKIDAEYNVRFVSELLSSEFNQNNTLNLKIKFTRK